MTSPFKFLQAYGPDDQAIFFGRNAELDRLEDLLARGRLVLVYGSSGTGKTSLVQCGLAGRFDPADWLPLVIRRKDNFPASLRAALAQLLDGNTVDQVGPAILEAYKNHLRPLYLIFDQLEEIFILGEAAERDRFFGDIAAILAADLPCKVILILREEYLAYLYEYELQIPQLLDYRLRVEPMSPASVEQVIRGSFEKFNIRLEEPAANLPRIIRNITDEKKRIQLPFLQVYLDRLYREDFRRTYPQGAPAGALPPLLVTSDELGELGRLEEILGRFLEEQVTIIQQELNGRYPEVPPDALPRLLDLFVTPEGTKRPVMKGEGDPAREIQAVLKVEGAQGEVAWRWLAGALERSRILRDNGDFFELSHDSLAEVIDRRRSEEQRLLNELKRRLANSFEEYRQTGTLLGEKQLLAFEDYLAKLALSEAQIQFVEESRNDVKRQKEEERAQQEKLWQEMNKARSNALAAQSILALFKDHLPLKSFRLAQYALRYNQDNATARGAVLNAFYHQVYPLRQNFYATPPSITLTHRGFLYHAAFAPDGQRVATVSNDRLVKLWSNKGELIAEMGGHQGSIWQVVFAPDGRRLVTCSYDKTARIWNVEGKLIAVLEAHGDSVWAAAWSPDGQSLATASGDGTVRVWSSDGRLLATLAGHSGEVRWVAYAPDGKLIGSASKDGTVRFWAPDGAERGVVKTHDGTVERVLFSPSGKQLLTFSPSDGLAKFWNYEGTLLATMKSPFGRITAAAYAPDGALVATGTENGIVHLWRSSGEHVTTLEGASGKINYCSFAPGGREVAAAAEDHTARIWDIRGALRVTLEGHRSTVWLARFSSDGRQLLTASKDQSAKVWPLQGLPLTVLRHHKGAVTGLQVDPQGQGVFSVSRDRALCLSQLDGSRFTVLYRADRPLNALAVNADGSMILVGGEGGNVELLDRSGKVLRKFEAYREKVSAAVFAPGGEELLIVSKDPAARIWKVNGKEAGVFNRHRSAVICAAFSPDGRHFATGSTDKTVVLWDRTTGNGKTLWGHTATVEAVAFAPDGRSLLSGSRDGTARLWSLEGEELVVMEGLVATLNAIAFSPDGRLIATGTGNGKIGIWDAKGVLQATLHGHTSDLFCLAFTPDGRRLLSGSKDKSIHVWNLDPGALIDQLDQIGADDLTKDEKEQYDIE